MMTRQEAERLARLHAPKLSVFNGHPVPPMVPVWVVNAIIDAHNAAAKDGPKILEQIADEWPKIALLILWKLNGENKVSITTDDVQALLTRFENEGGPSLFTEGHATSMDYQIISGAAREAYTQKHNPGAGPAQ